MFQLVKTEDGIKVTTDHGEELMTDVVLLATGNIMSLKSINKRRLFSRPCSHMNCSLYLFLHLFLSLFTGRIPNSKRLNLQAVGVEVDNVGAIKVRK